MSLSYTSMQRLSTCHEDLQRLVDAVVDGIDAGEMKCADLHDITVLCGYRDKEAQEKAFADGASKVHWPNSKHNSLPSRAVDLAPFPVDWKNRDAFLVLRGYVGAVAARLGIKIRFISWDAPHVELV